MELVLKCTKSKLNHAISKLATEAGNLELEIDVLYVWRAKLGKVTRELPKLGKRMGFSKLEGRNPPQ
jgi:hypothetical protein